MTLSGLLQGKRAIVTGGASGIGQKAVQLFLEQGARVVIADVNAEKGEALAAALGDNAYFYTCNLALHYALDNIRVNAVSPGFIETPLTTLMSSTPEIVEAYAEHIPMGRPGQPGEVANAILFLASDLASYITGQELCADGGITAWNGQPRFTRILGDITVP